MRISFKLPIEVIHVTCPCAHECDVWWNLTYQCAACESEFRTATHYNLTQMLQYFSKCFNFFRIFQKAYCPTNNDCWNVIHLQPILKSCYYKYYALKWVTINTIYQCIYIIKNQLFCHLKGDEYNFCDI